ncbi:hypothetical protein CKY20_11565 [Capnocytophaga canis]|uniref:Uncharacterized protein n=1 Tax=Capnocytophaga canis TaxID=1848903 RepID=A0A3A1YCP8_9FLAO|nr:hypothetical protein [Capnocytophaga canis]RIY34940.1 hypothetical protein CKY20_11565 [Capnocytophaga canis]
MQGSIYISCVDTANARFEIAQILTDLKRPNHYHNTPLYWFDFGNNRHTGQVVLSTIGSHPQPQSEEMIGIENLPFVTDEFYDFFMNADQNEDTPSCSLADALHRPLYQRYPIANGSFLALEFVSQRTYRQTRLFSEFAGF